MRNFLNIQSLFIICLTASLCRAGYGDAPDGSPAWKERQILTLTNACRMAPVEYRTSYVGSYAILDPANYPATFPLYWNAQLNKAARAHSLDMGDTCGSMQHASCNGTAWDVRIKRYYTASSSIAENIAVGNADPFTTMAQWIKDIIPATGQPAADLSGSDGHRKNIMSGNYRELGTGYAYGSKSGIQYHHYWTQDFGGGKTAFTNPIVSAAHFFKTSGSTLFLADYYDSTQHAPQSAVVVCSGIQTVLTLSMGTAWRGTYQASLPQGNGCRTYFFIFIDAAGKTWRYPESGGLVTTGEGACTREYAPAESLATRQPSLLETHKYPVIHSRIIGDKINVSIQSHAAWPRETMLYDCRGASVQSIKWPDRQGRCALQTPLQKKASAGIYFIVHRLADNQNYIEPYFLK